MLLKKWIFFIGFFSLGFTEGRSCSCAHPLYFCEYIRDTTVKIAFQARVVEKKDYGRLFGEYQNLIGTPRKAIEIDGFGNGWHVLEIQCNGRKFYRKVIVFN